MTQPWCKTVFFLAACYQPLEQFVSRNSRCTTSTMLLRDTWNYCDKRRWVISRTLSPHKPFWLLVHARYDLTFAVRYDCDDCYRSSHIAGELRVAWI